MVTPKEILLFCLNCCTQAKLAEKAAIDAQEKIDSQALPIRAYLDQTVVPILLQGLSDLVKARYRIAPDCFNMLVLS